ncbi:MAG: ethanolamine ammonia-lyase subunit EutC [Desulfovibrio sp.]|jgi:ethanolamine ammonia-lyase small subunit|nr:ethanolamine ammonia-lyase subunit EutC [Desulfovibrio sp.]
MRAVKPTAEDPWKALRLHTQARIALGRCGVSLPVAAWLEFRLAHARARDAVLTGFDKEFVRGELEKQGLDVLTLKSAALDREEFLARPDKGRRLSGASAAALREYADSGEKTGADVCLVISNGLSARAIHDNAPPFAAALTPRLAAAGLSLAPVVVVDNGRVAVADEITHMVRARLSVILIGERPGLSSPDSMGVYMTFEPKPGCTDETRNCISNVRPGGLGIAESVRKLCYLVQHAFSLGYSGIRLKDDMPAAWLPPGQPFDSHKTIE